MVQNSASVVNGLHTLNVDIDLLYLPLFLPQRTGGLSPTPRGRLGWPKFSLRHLGAPLGVPPGRLLGPSALALDLQSPLFEAIGF